MKKYLSIIFFAVFILASVSDAGDKECADCYEIYIEVIEDAAVATKAERNCRVADLMEQAVNYLYACEKICVGSPVGLEAIRQSKPKAIKMLAMYVKLCGH